MPECEQGEARVDDVVRVVLGNVLGIGQSMLDATAGADEVTRSDATDELALRVVLLAHPAGRHTASDEPVVTAPSRLRSDGLLGMLRGA